jgi:hypothetical protein
MAPHPRLLGRVAACVIIAMGLFGSLPAVARHGHGEVAQTAETGPVFAWILLDAETGQVLSEQTRISRTIRPRSPR